MQFGRLFLAAAASAAVQALELTDPTFAGITVGEVFDVTWKDATGDVTIVLLDDSNPLNAIPVATIASGLTGTSFEWTPSATLINAADYAIKIVDQVTSNYGAQFQLVGGATATPSSTAATSTTVPATTTSDTTTSSTTTTESSTSSVPSTTSAPTTSASSTPFTNSTTTRTQSSSSSKAASSTTAPVGSQTSAPSSANSIASPLALILLTVAALISLN
ncbi:hypothetical protein OIDMADRAFT_182107 [Oidiodendron maius Zn]|uniref:Yeast cell wall synthesis Kre9/Knh1-like N-terminal domain-containing protein n=1 Tax=Oidiodendron maius (strain Zn) TaxID=913774 RepID=A0A0C3H2X4_OIDMZ|nr:hypothetical protein OIDMADRAFT_182107 [Oidiodendron maius Zn]